MPVIAIVGAQQAEGCLDRIEYRRKMLYIATGGESYAACLNARICAIAGS